MTDPFSYNGAMISKLVYHSKIFELFNTEEITGNCSISQDLGHFSYDYCLQYTLIVGKGL